MSKKNPLEAIYFPVKKVAGSDLLPKFTFNNKHSHFIIAKGERVLAAVSPGYELIPNEELIQPIVERLQREFTFKVNVRQHGSSKFYVDFLFGDNTFQIAKDDIVPKIRLHNSYDGSLKFEFHAGLHRVVCSNGMTVPIDGASNIIKLMHTPAAKGVNDTTLKYIDNFLEHAEELKGIYKPLVKVKLNLADAEKKLEELNEKKIIGPKLLELAKFRLVEESQMGLPITEFLVYNAANYAINHNEGKVLPHKREKQDRKLIDYMLK